MMIEYSKQRLTQNKPKFLFLFSKLRTQKFLNFHIVFGKLGTGTFLEYLNNIFFSN